MAEKFAIRVPVFKAHKPDFEFVEIDLEHLDESIYTELYTQVHYHGRNGRTKWERVAGYRPRAIDVSRLHTLVREILQQWEAALNGTGDRGTQLWKESFQALPFERLVATLTARQLGGAEDALRDILYGLMTATATMATELVRHSETVSGMDESNIRLAETVRVSGPITDDFCLDWGIVAEEINRTVAELTDLERTVVKIRHNASEVQARIFRSGAGSSLERARTFFDGEASLGFLIEMSRYLRGELSLKDQEVAERLTEAQQHLVACQNWEEDARHQWKPTQNQLTDLLTIQRRLSALAGVLETNYRTWLTYTERLAPGTMRPYDRGAITREEFDRAERAVLDPGWSARQCRERLGALIDATITLVNDEPVLPEEIRALVRQAELIIKRWEPAAPAPLVDQTVKPSSATRQDDGTTGRMAARPIRPVPAPSSERVEELYAYVLMIGQVLTNKPSPIAQSNVRALLNVAAKLGWCTETEVVGLYDGVNERSKRDREHVPAATAVVQRWRESTATWLQYKIRRLWCLKVTLHAADMCARLIQTNGADVEEIKRVHREHRDAKRQSYRERRAAHVPKPKGE